eukprot:CAMPEP_0170525076 /NCGR_PEP_ID=MMETSP0209-20121228/10540_1 /TAXON_ID=665100 ORGANISM="Litonotus pictus, Strain P1" /NCGR_SAMPLE_ID=MMETSP0209 /ASSEMBLY_ACC=CAM_ASM_000301 /LENGTH=626 /DNA_ID=CAMNT_0010814135 /DNA_START=26 /DNA_END=1906 /DNA_ORIENTATION=+
MTISILFGKDLVIKPNPQVVSSSLRDEGAILKGEDLFVGIKVTLPGGKIVGQEYLDIVFGSIRTNYSVDPHTVSFKFTPSRPCGETVRFKNNSKQLIEIGGLADAFLCPPDSYYEDLIGSIGAGTAFAYDIRVKFCTNSTKNNNHCKPKEEMREYLKELYGVIAYRDNIIDPMQLDEPLTAIYNTMAFRLSSKATREETLYYKAFELRTDLGFIMESISEQRYFFSNQRLGDIFPDDNPKNIFRVKFSSEKTKIKMIRSYIKIRKVAADIGGIVKFFMICVSIINNIYGKFHFLVYMQTRLLKESKDTVTFSLKDNKGNKGTLGEPDSSKGKQLNNHLFPNLVKQDWQEYKEVSESSSKKDPGSGVNIENKSSPSKQDQIKERSIKRLINDKEDFEPEVEKENEDRMHSEFPLNKQEFMVENLNINNNKQSSNQESPSLYEKRECRLMHPSSPCLDVPQKKEERVNNYLDREEGDEKESNNQEMRITQQRNPLNKKANEGSDEERRSKRKEDKEINSNSNINNNVDKNILVLKKQSTLRNIMNASVASQNKPNEKEEREQRSCGSLRNFWEYYCVCQRYKKNTLKLIEKHIQTSYSIEGLLEIKENQNIVIGKLFAKDAQNNEKEV